MFCIKSAEYKYFCEPYI